MQESVFRLLASKRKTHLAQSTTSSKCFAFRKVNCLN